MGWGQFGTILWPAENSQMACPGYGSRDHRTPKLGWFRMFQVPNTTNSIVGQFVPPFIVLSTPFQQSDLKNWGSGVKIQQEGMSGNHGQRGTSVIRNPVVDWSSFQNCSLLFPHEHWYSITCRNISKSCVKRISVKHLSGYHVKQCHIIQAMRYVPLFLMGLSEDRVP